MSETVRINHLLPEDDGDHVKLLVDVLMDLLSVITPVQDDVGKQQIGVTVPQLVEQPKDDRLIRNAGRGDETDQKNATDGSQPMSLVTDRVFVAVMPLAEE